MYQDIQKKYSANSPFLVFIFQQTEVAGYRKGLTNFKLGLSFDTNFVGMIGKE